MLSGYDFVKLEIDADASGGESGGSDERPIMNELTYRAAHIEDLESLIELRVEFLEEANGKPHEDPDSLRADLRSYFSQHLVAGSFVAWLCEHVGEIVATSGISFYDLPPSYSNSNGKVGYIMNMYTKPPFRGKGIARSLFIKMLDEGTKRNVGKFVLHATKDGEYLYKQHGFSMSGDEMILTAPFAK